METFKKNFTLQKSGMELVQVAIMIALAVTLGLVFKSQITNFVNGIFKTLNGTSF